MAAKSPQASSSLSSAPSSFLISPLSLSFSEFSHESSSLQERVVTRSQKRKERWIHYNLDAMPADVVALILSYLPIDQYEIVKKMFLLPRVSKRMYQVIQEVFSRQCARKPQIIKNVMCSNDSTTVLKSIQITSCGPTFDGFVEKCLRCSLYYCKICKENWCTGSKCRYCSECCRNYMSFGKKCSICGELYSTIAAIINNELDMELSDSDEQTTPEYLCSRDVVSDCNCSKGDMCIICHGDIYVV